MRQGGESQGVQVVRQGEPTPYHCDFNPLYLPFTHIHLSTLARIRRMAAAFARMDSTRITS